MKNHKLKNYRNRVWDEIEGLDSFSIELVPREMNKKSNSLAVFASLLLPHPKFKDKKYQIEIVYRAFVLDNIDSWQVFKDEKSLQLFLENNKTTSGCQFNEKDNEDSSHEVKENQVGKIQL